MPEEIKKVELGDQNLGKAGTPNLGEARSPDLGQACSPNLGQATSPKDGQIICQYPKCDIMVDKDKRYCDKHPEGKEIKLTPPTDFKIAEIWIRSEQIMLDAAESFWSDRCRALGVLEFCKDIVKTAQAPKKPNIIIPGNGKMLNFARNLFKRRR